jgi:DNA-binding LytR/AlgR family response regulator
MSTVKTCLIVDDEPPARLIIRSYLESIPGLECVGECNNAIEALDFLRRQPVDVLFLDIQMPSLNGIELARTMDKRPGIIFTTAYRDYAVEGFELGVEDYLLKPFSFQRFVKSVNKVLQQPVQAPVASAPVKGSHTADDFLYFRVDRKMQKIWLRDILYIESLKDYVRIATSTDKPFVTKESISAIEQLLPADDFIRIHRSYIISRDKVSAYVSEYVEIDRIQLPIGRLYRMAVLQKLNKS